MGKFGYFNGPSFTVLSENPMAIRMFFTVNSRCDRYRCLRVSFMVTCRCCFSYYCGQILLAMSRQEEAIFVKSDYSDFSLQIQIWTK